MKISVKNTSLFDPALKETLLGAYKDQLGSLERETVYRFRMAFDEMQIYKLTKAGRRGGFAWGL